MLKFEVASVPDQYRRVFGRRAPSAGLADNYQAALFGSQGWLIHTLIQDPRGEKSMFQTLELFLFANKMKDLFCGLGVRPSCERKVYDVNSAIYGQI